MGAQTAQALPTPPSALHTQVQARAPSPLKMSCWHWPALTTPHPPATPGCSPVVELHKAPTGHNEGVS